jgi:membrane-anchored glycerophosphoryl diester phosphodiesterase (GDPDase)
MMFQYVASWETINSLHLLECIQASYHKTQTAGFFYLIDIIKIEVFLKTLFHIVTGGFYDFNCALKEHIVLRFDIV